MLTLIAPTVDVGRRYSIAQTCSLLGVSRKTLRKWTVEGKIQAKAHPADGHLFYLAEEISRFWNQSI